MASWIVHLRIADDLLTRIDGLDAALFAIGNIAPDSGIPDEKWETFNPPTEVTHFQTPNLSKRGCEDLRFYREYVSGYDTTDCLGYSFRLGYFFHLVTDNLWSREIGQPTKQKYEAEFAADKDFIWTVKKDWYGLDFQHVHANPGSLFWRVFVPAEYDRADLPFLPDGAVKQQVQYIKDYYRRADPEIMELIEHPYVYLTQVEMDAFVRQASDSLLAIYHGLRNGATSGKAYTALDLPL
jgi:hypothetical protein